MHAVRHINILVLVSRTGYIIIGAERRVIFVCAGLHDKIVTYVRVIARCYVWYILGNLRYRLHAAKISYVGYV